MRTERVAQVSPPALCMFEYIYFARPDSVLSGRSIYMARYQMGRALAREHPVDADVVMAVPDSAIPGGIGYASESGLPYVEGLIKNRYIGRTFISPDQQMRNQGVQLKFNPIVENLRGSASSWSTTRSSAGRRRRASCGCCATPARAKCTCASPRRRSCTRAIWASTWRPTRS